MTKDEAQQLEFEAARLYERGATGQEFEALFARGWRPPSMRGQHYPDVKPAGYPTYRSPKKTLVGRPKRTPEEELERARKRRVAARERRQRSQLLRLAASDAK